MASPAQWTWVWVNSRSWWWTGRPGVLRSTGLQSVGHDWETDWCSPRPPVCSPFCLERSIRSLLHACWPTSSTAPQNTSSAGTVLDSPNRTAPCSPWPCFVCLFLGSAFLCSYETLDTGGSDETVKYLPAMQETWVWSLGQEDPLEKQMATHSSILAWRIPWMEEPGGPWSIRAKSQTGLKWFCTMRL